MGKQYEQLKAEKRAIVKDENPAAVKRTLRQKPAFGEVFERFIDKKGSYASKPLSPKSIAGYRSTVNLHLERIINDQLSR